MKMNGASEATRFTSAPVPLMPPFLSQIRPLRNTRQPHLLDQLPRVFELIKRKPKHLVSEHCQMRFSLALRHKRVDGLPALAGLQRILPLPVQLADDARPVLEPPEIVDPKHVARIKRVMKLHLKFRHRKAVRNKESSKTRLAAVFGQPVRIRRDHCALRCPRRPSQSARSRSRNSSRDEPFARKAESAIASPYENGTRSRQSSTVRQNDVTCTPSTRSSTPAAYGRSNLHPPLNATEQPVLTRKRGPSKSFGTSRPHRSAASYPQNAQSG